ncbi:hypothetical protein B0H16DRAFT_1404449 [Mycena metata]|uniref:BTB domain-containing protein n=1 Tax=Mycena metata TaxID=1033252 RepID=A0AAD7K9J0_9AGAR|nr:hypothetical protein B0H16DRAFT_1404449 [Mycena metata]
MPYPPVSYNLPPHEVNASSHSPTTSTSRGRRPSISNPMHWLSRNSTQSSVTSVKQARISEPKLIHSLELPSSRAGVLGSGATVVRTPDEALRATRVRLTYDGFGEQQDRQSGEQERAEEHTQEIEYRSPSTSTDSSSSEDEDEIPSPLDSPPLPPVPSEDKSSFPHDAPPTPQAFTFPPRPNRAVPTVPGLALRPSLKTRRTESVDASSALVPALPANIPAIPAPPAFNAILLSDIPPLIADRSRIIVSLETCTATYKTTLDTLSSRPSFLSSYIASLFGRRRSDSLASSVYSTDSAAEDRSAYRQHLASQGLLPQSSSSVHIFLDRPSEPYVHILSYLRSPCSSPEGPEVLPPRAASAGLDTLLELRDEASYLGLDGLHKLCVEEIRQQHRSRPRSSRGHSAGAGSLHSLHASVTSLHTMLERVERQSHSRAPSKDVEEPAARSLPTPESFAGGRHTRSQTRQGSLRSPPPAGWI